MENNKKFILFVLPEKLGICHLGKNVPVPEWASQGEFFSITRTSQELSIVYPQKKIPAGILFEKNWRAFRIDTILSTFSSVGVIAALANPLAEAGISILNISTYETNYLLVEEKNLERAAKALSSFCHIKR
ncbi:MAG: ACT domain-containing protein [bacterium]|nr:ACT domain-containing protein [bacterium]